MTHTEALNMMLATSCPSEVLWSHVHHADVYYFTFEGHCTTYEVEAILISTVNTIQYKIINVEVKE